MLSMTSMLAESGVGQYMDAVRDRLVERQRALVHDLFAREIRDVLLQISGGSSGVGLFHMNEEDLSHAQDLIEEICG